VATPPGISEQRSTCGGARMIEGFRSRLLVERLVELLNRRRRCRIRLELFTTLFNNGNL
jgi:hypothetical protein